MEIISNREETIFKNEKDGKVSYSIGISKKKEDGTYENGYIPCRFRKDVSVDNKTRINIKNAWIDFYKIDKRTFLYVFINDFEIANKIEQKEEQQEEKSFDNWQSAKDIEEDSMELPFY